jgi:hypothetical protein
MILKKHITTLLVIALLSSCTYISDLKRTGDVKNITLDWSGNENIEIWAPCKLVLVNSAETRIELSGMDFIVDGYDLLQNEENLVIEHNNPNGLQEDKIVEIRLYAPNFKKITANSPCKIANVDTLIFSKLAIVVNGKGIYTTSDLTMKGNNFHLWVYGGINKSRHLLKGKIDNAYYETQGGTDIDALNLQTLTTTIVQKSYGHYYINCTEELNVTTYSTGNVYYSGNPTVTFTTQENAIMKASGGVFRIVL